jgi:hypothetical protein
MPKEKTPATQSLRQSIVRDLKGELKRLDHLRIGTDAAAPIDISLATYAKERWGFAPSENGCPDNFLMALGINPGVTTIAQLMGAETFIDEGFRFLFPEIIREAIRIGTTRPAIYPQLIAAEENIPRRRITMPSVKMSDAAAKITAEGASINAGTMEFSSKQLTLQNLTIGIELSDQIVMECPLNLLGMYMRDVGTQLGYRQDLMALNALIFGDNSDNPEAAAVIGVNTASVIAYRDLLRAWVRMSGVGQRPTSMVANEDTSIAIQELDEFKKPYPSYIPQGAMNPSGLGAPALNPSAPIPTAQDFITNAGIPATQTLLVNRAQALVKFNATALRVEQQRNAQRQYDGYYASIVTGFGTLNPCARLIIDSSILFSSHGFPDFMALPTATLS